MELIALSRDIKTKKKKNDEESEANEDVENEGIWFNSGDMTEGDC